MYIKGKGGRTAGGSEGFDRLNGFNGFDSPPSLPRVLAISSFIRRRVCAPRLD